MLGLGPRLILWAACDCISAQMQLGSGWDISQEELCWTADCTSNPCPKSPKSPCPPGMYVLLKFPPTLTLGVTRELPSIECVGNDVVLVQDLLLEGLAASAFALFGASFHESGETTCELCCECSHMSGLSSTWSRSAQLSPLPSEWREIIHQCCFSH